jgi:hypothetical protein
MKDVAGDLFQKKNVPQVILSLLFLIFLVSNYPLPYFISTIVDTIYGKMAVILIFTTLFLYSNPIVGILGILVGFQLIVKSSIEQGTFVYNEKEQKKLHEMKTMNRNIKKQQVDSLEHDIIQKMAPTSNDFGVTFERDDNIHPIINNLYDASPITSSN